MTVYAIIDTIKRENRDRAYLSSNYPIHDFLRFLKFVKCKFSILVHKLLATRKVDPGSPTFAR